MIRAQGMGRYVENNILDMGITGLDWVLEQNSEVTEIAACAMARWVSGGSNGLSRCRTIQTSRP